MAIYKYPFVVRAGFYWVSFDKCASSDHLGEGEELIDVEVSR